MSKKIQAIQGLRGVAIILIVLWHLNSVFPKILPPLGDRGVEFFLIISGFLVAAKHLNGNSLNRLSGSIRYSFNKIKQLYPLYILSALPMIFLAVRKINDFSGIIDIAKKTVLYGLVVQSWIPNENYYWALNGVTWFLSTIAFCYIATPFVFYVLKKIRGMNTLLVCLVFKFAIEIICHQFFSESLATYFTYIFPVYRLFDYAMGICLFELLEQKNEYEGGIPQTGSKSKSILFIFVLVAYVVLVLIGKNVYLYSVFHISELAIVWIIVSERTLISKFLFENKVVVWLGNISMEIFLTHLPVISYLSIVWEKVLGKNLPAVEWLVILAVIFMVAAITNKILSVFRNRKRQSAKSQ